jgi:hypothetical protein
MARGDPPIILEALAPYFRGAYFAAEALKGRLEKRTPGEDAAVQVVRDYQEMVTQFRHAVHETIELKRKSQETG